jgi:hypothetical protein
MERLPRLDLGRGAGIWHEPDGDEFPGVAAADRGDDLI